MSAVPPLFTRLLRLLVPVVFLGLCTARNLPWRLSDYDQAKQAFVSLELAGNGNPWFQHTPAGRLATKPPLLGWLSAGVHAVLPRGEGSWDLAWRLPSMLATLALAGLLGRAGRALWPAGGAWLALGMFGLNLLTPRLATLARTDMTLTLWTTAAGLLVWHRRRVGGAWTRGECWTLLGALTAAVLTKGPIVYAFLLPGVVALTLWERPRMPLPVWPWLLPLGVFGLWVAAGWWTVPGFYEQIIGREFLGRFDYSERAVHIRQPAWFYAAVLCGRMAPWSLLLAGTAFVARPAWRAVSREPAGRWLVCWAAGGLLFMSAVPSKRVDRIFPVVPPLCLLLTAVVGRARESSPAGTAAPGRRVETWAAWTTAAALVVAGGATGYETRKSYLRHEDALDNFGRHIRAMTDARGWRPVELAVGPRVDESEQTLLVCLRRLRCLDDAAAADAWRTGEVDALVLQTSTLESIRGSLGAEGDGFTIEARLEKSRERNEPYVLIARRPPASSPPGP